VVAQTTNTAPVVERVSSDPVLERTLIALAVAVFALVVREVWQAFRARRERRARDRAILSTLLRQLSVVAGITSSVSRDINKERELLAAQERWRLKPLLRFPTTIYDLVQPHIPLALLKQEGAVRTLLVLQTQCEYTNALTAEHQKWKTPEARGQPDQIETILSFHESIMESVNAVANRCNDVIPLVHAAGETVGGLNLEGPQQRPSRWKRITQRVPWTHSKT
jgi:hypothetical protein